jgi:hypothetical protein
MLGAALILGALRGGKMSGGIGGHWLAITSANDQDTTERDRSPPTVGPLHLRDGER